MIHFNLSDYLSFKFVASIITISTNISHSTPPSEPIQLPTPSIPRPTPPSSNRINIFRQKEESSIELRSSLRAIPTISNQRLRNFKQEKDKPTVPPQKTPTPTPRRIIIRRNPTPTPKVLPTSTPIPPTPTAKPTQTPSNPGNSITEVVNNYREDHRLNSLQQDSDICRVAERRAKDAAENFSHDGFEEGVSELKYSKAAENLWQGQPFTLGRMIDAWDDSPGHQRNLVGDYNYGCGARSGDTVAFIFINR